MKKEIKERIDAVRRSKTPDGYYENVAGIMPTDWSCAPLHAISEVLSEQAGDREFETLSISAGIGFVNQAEKFGKELSGKQYAKYTVLRRGDFAYNKGNSKRYPQGCTYMLRERDEAAVPNVFECFRITQGHAEYYEQLFINGFMNKQLTRKINHGVRDDGLLNLTDDDFYSTVLPAPPLAEQQKIAEILATCDRVIELKQCEIDELNKLKQTYLRKMFPQKGKTVPEIRFPDFSDPWEQRKFSDLTEIRSASRVHKEEWQTSGVPFYRSSDVMAALNGTENEKAFISEELYEKLSAVSGKLEKGDVLVTGGGSVGKPYIVPNNEPLYTKDADLLWIKKNENLDPYFVYAFFFSPTFTDYLNSVSHVGTIAHYTITQLGETPISLPCVSEQQKIGTYFRNLDHLITLHQRELEEYGKYKKALMQLLLTGLVRVNA